MTLLIGVTKEYATSSVNIMLLLSTVVFTARQARCISLLVVLSPGQSDTTQLGVELSCVEMMMKMKLPILPCAE